MKNYRDYRNKGVELVSNKKNNLKFVIFISFCTVSLIAILLTNKTYSKVKASSDISSNVNFDTLSDDYNYSYKRIKSDFGDINFVKGNDRLFIKDDALWIKYPLLKSGLNNSGAMINSKIEASKEYNLEYEVYFDGCGNLFDYQDGGILSGLSGGEFYDGNSKKTSEEGFHVMLTYNNYGYIYPLIYSVNDANVGGNIYNEIGKFKENAWNKIKMYVKVNDKDKENGILRVWINDKLCFNNEEIRYTTSDLLIDTNNLCVYNNDSNKVVDHEQFVYIDNYNIYTD